VKNVEADKKYLSAKSIIVPRSMKKVRRKLDVLLTKASNQRLEPTLGLLMDYSTNSPTL